jgi:hypothetical protein
MASRQTSNKRSNKQERELKKLATQRTKEERQTELNNVFNKLQELGISREFVGINEFYKLAEDFIAFGNPMSGKIKVPAINRDLHYLLNNNKKHEIKVLLRESM